MNILVTGGAGFIGSNFIKHMLLTYNYKIVNLDLLTYAGNLNNLDNFANDPRYQFIQGDIREKDIVNELFQRYSFDIVINFAAESHVDRSIEDPRLFLETNVIGTQVLLETAKKHWKLNPNNHYCTKFKKNTRYIQISTDEVYGELGKEGYFTEKTNLSPNSPYSASKASADMVARAYYETYGLPVMITRCSNNYGPYQYPEKLIPLIILNAVNGKSIPVYGNGKQIRDWLHVEDHCKAIDAVMHKGEIGEIYNIGGNNEKENLAVVKGILDLLGLNEDRIEFVNDRLGHDKRYAIDNTKVIRELGWFPAYTFEDGIKQTVKWYLDNEDWMNSVNSRKYLLYDKL